MPELITEEPKNWLQLYVDAVTEKDPYKRLALVRRLRQVPRHDESDENERPRLQVMSKPAGLKPALRRLAAPKAAESSFRHVIRSGKAKSVSKTQRRSARLRSA
jgi:hypothetical protein